MTFLEAFLATLVLLFVLRWWLHEPRCKDCGAKAMPHTHDALIKACHRADRNEKDAERYRWLKEKWSTNHGSSVVTWSFGLGFTEVYDFEPLVDKAMAAEKGLAEAIVSACDAAQGSGQEKA